VAHRCATEGRVARGSGGQCRFRGGCYRGGPSPEVEGGQEGGGGSVTGSQRVVGGAGEEVVSNDRCPNQSQKRRGCVVGAAGVTRSASMRSIVM
jgi:hypothetical protein